MSSKVNIPFPKVAKPGDVRNVVLVGHSGSGKTTLFEHLLRSRIDGYRGEKQDPERAAALTLASIPTPRVVINLLDAPGHPDFTGELRAGLRAADAAIFVVSAADGVDAITTNLWHECASVGMPRAVVVTKLDAGKADFDEVVAICQRTFGDGVLASHLPVFEGDETIVAVLDLLTQKINDYSTGERVVRDAESEHMEIIENHRSRLIEGIIQESEDDELMDHYLAGEDLAMDAVERDLLTAVAHATFHPVLPVSNLTGVGVEELIELIEKGFPTPDLHPLPSVTTPDGDELPPASADESGPLIAEIVVTNSDPYAGRQSMVRVFSGTLRPDEVVHVSGHRARFSGVEDNAHPDHDLDERVGPLSIPMGLELKSAQALIAGQIGVISKLAHAETSDTLSAKDSPALVEPWVLPEPLLPVAIRAITRNDEDKLAVALQRLAVEDTTLRLERAAETDQLILWTMGQAHVDLLLARLAEKYGVKVSAEEVMVSLRETFVAPSKGHGRHVKQSGGHGQFAVCDIEVEPLPRGTGFEFVDKVVGGSVPRQFIPSVEKGVRAQLEKGVIAGYPMVDVRVTLYEGKAHSVDSSDMAFQTAGSMALKEAAAKPGVTALLEPIAEVTITVGDEFLGAVMSDISGRRGSVLGTDSGSSGQSKVRALVPELELSRYAIDLRGIAHGTGSFTRARHGFDMVPAHLVDKLSRKQVEKD